MSNALSSSPQNLPTITSSDQIQAEGDAFVGNDELFSRSEVFKPTAHEHPNHLRVPEPSVSHQVFSKAIKREDSATLDDIEKGGSEGNNEKEELGGNDALPEKKPESDEDFKITWLGSDDPTNPHNWGVFYRWFLTVLGGLATLNATFSSSVPSESVPQMQKYFGFSQEVGTLTISLFICGYIAGPLIWGPASEVFGRRIIFICAYLPYTLFDMAGGLSKNTASILIFRLLAGLFAACPIVLSGALLADIWDAKRRGIAMSVFALTPFAGPALGPIVSGFIAVTGTSWRWTFWVMTIFSGVILTSLILLLPETYGPVLQAKNAKRKRQETGDERYWAPHERKDKSLKFLLKNSFVFPFKMLIEEPMLLAITLYQSFIYGIMYLQFESFGYIFAEVYHLSSGLTGCTFLTIFVGGLLANIILIVYDGPRYAKKVDEYAPKPVPPETRLPTSIIAAALFPIGMLWMGWTCYPSISLASPILAATLLGGCILVLFLTLINYTVDTYLFKAATALAASTVVRSCFGAAFPLFADQMYNKLNVHWATTLLACIAILGAPLPIILIKYGPKLRKMSKNSPY